MADFRPGDIVKIDKNGRARVINVTRDNRINVEILGTDYDIEMSQQRLSKIPRTETSGATTHSHYARGMDVLQKAEDREKQRKPFTGDITKLQCGDNPQPSEGRRWFKQAYADFNAIQNDQNSSPCWACFKSLQAAEKALKAVMYHKNANDRVLREHDITKIAGKLDFEDLAKSARELHELFGVDANTKLRYPDKHHGKIPSEVYTPDDANKSQRIFKTIFNIIETYWPFIVQIDKFKS